MLSATYLHITVIILPITATITSPGPLKHVIAYKMFPYSLPYWTCISQKREKSRIGIRISNFADGKTEVEGSEALPDLVPKTARLHSSCSFCLVSSWHFLHKKTSNCHRPRSFQNQNTPTAHRPQSLLLSSPIPSLLLSLNLRSLTSPSVPGWHSKPDWGLSMLLTSLRVKMYIPETAA